MPSNSSGSAFTDNPTVSTQGSAADASGANFNINSELPWYQLASLNQNNANNYALQSAQNKAQAAYQSKLVQLQSQGLGLQAKQIAQQYALEQAKLEFEKQSFAQTFGAQQANTQWQQGFDQRAQELDNAYKVAEQTGFRNGVPTLANMQLQQQNSQFQANLGFQNQQLTNSQEQFNRTAQQNERDYNQSVTQFNATQQEAQRQYDLSQAQQAAQFGQTFGEGQRQFNVTTGNQVDQFGRTLGENQRQFDVTTGNQVDQFGRTLAEQQRATNLSTVLNAPRGPADWAAYTNRLRGLQSSGTLPGGMSSFGSVGPQASFSSGGQATGPVLSNTQLALAATGQGNAAQLNGTPWQGVYGAQNSAPSGGGGGATQSDDTSYSGGSSPYGGGGSSYGGPAGGATAQPQGQGSASDISLPSLQKYRRYAPTEQQMGLGYIEENGGPTAEDSQYLMRRSAPNMAQSRGARYAGM